MQHDYFEAGHSKNESDQMGGHAKGAWERGVARETWEESPTTMEEIRDMLERNLPGSSMKSTDFIKFVVLPPLVRPTKEEEGQIPVKGIMKLHSIVRRPGGEIHGLSLSCKICTSQEAMCDQCAELPPLYTPAAEAEPADGEESEDEEVEEGGGDAEGDGGDEDGELSGEEEEGGEEDWW